MELITYIIIIFILQVTHAYLFIGNNSILGKLPYLPIIYLSKYPTLSLAPSYYLYSNNSINYAITWIVYMIYEMLLTSQLQMTAPPDSIRTDLLLLTPYLYGTILKTYIES